MKKLLAFTLAETLIVIGIIGVVSALTLPNLNSSTGEKEKVAKVKKIYQNLEDALGRAVAIYGPVEEWFVNDTTDTAQATRFKNRVTEFLKVSKDCGTSTGCWSTNPQRSYGGTVWESNYYQSLVNDEGFGGSVILADGTALAFIDSHGFRIRADIDGPNKGKTATGVDIFDFYYDWYDEYRLFPSYNLDLVPPEVSDGYVTDWVINFGNMDYLKCPDDLSWDNKTSCK